MRNTKYDFRHDTDSNKKMQRISIPKDLPQK